MLAFNRKQHSVNATTVTSRVTTWVTCDHNYCYEGIDVPTDHADELLCDTQRAPATQALQVWGIFCSDGELNRRGCDWAFPTSCKIPSCCLHSTPGAQFKSMQKTLQVNLQIIYILVYIIDNDYVRLLLSVIRRLFRKVFPISAHFKR